MKLRKSALTEGDRYHKTESDLNEDEKRRKKRKNILNKMKMVHIRRLNS